MRVVGGDREKGGGRLLEDVDGWMDGKRATRGLDDDELDDRREME
jgi:hypothetical protein